jgi:signal transduction histidine kinase
MIPVVLIDAKTDRRTALEQYLAGTGSYRVIAVPTGEVTINRSLVDARAVIVVVQDAGQDSISVLHQVSEQNIALPVIILGTTCDPVVFREAVMRGAEYVIMTGSAEEWQPVFGCVLGRVIEIRNLRDSVEVFRKKLNLVGSVTRHDVLNQLTAVNGYTELLEMMVEDPQMKSFIEKERHAVEKIRRQFAFAKDYQNLGTEPPRWQLISSAIRRATEPVSLNGITLNETCGTGIVYADPALDKAFTQLLDNTVRYGEKASEIRVFVQASGNGTDIVFEDNGTGIPIENKERIFERGFGKNTGWGLFLVREILMITGISVKENGEPGKGARFVLHIPNGAYKEKGEVTPAFV